ncbi:uncharacterized protein PAC_06042 [Phialocephala subalpina]|uniref:Uncharacterized protein n=1 Tax=Phialocephala subalpina TaxID=576137 RepID=A0A1L7WTP5_9HELO|nr:uncharacterized protein PAC_06042 [Phialocephala subalpina]
MAIKARRRRTEALMAGAGPENQSRNGSIDVTGSISTTKEISSSKNEALTQTLCASNKLSWLPEPEGCHRPKLALDSDRKLTYADILQNAAPPLDPLLESVYKVWTDVRAGKVACSGPDKYGSFDLRLIQDKLEEGLCNDEELMRLVLKISADRVIESVSPNYSGNTPNHRFDLPELRALWDEYDLNDYY